MSAHPVEIFYSYAHEDEPLRHELERHLSILHRQGLISSWHDRQIVSGTDWAKAIDIHLETASLILLFISADFLASDYCYGIEMKRALERHQASEARVIPVLMRPVAWKGAPFEYLQVLPTDARSVTEWDNRDAAFCDIVTGIQQAIEDLPRLLASAPPATFPRIWNVPYPRNALFTGRDELLAHLSTTLTSDHATALSQTQAICGLGGIGKTQIAVEYAYRHCHEYRAVLWTLADTRESLVSGYIAIAGLLNLPEKEALEQTVIVKSVVRWLTTNSGWLLILDNADDLAIVREFVPSVFGGRILLTTRAQAMGRLASRIEVNTMPQDVGALFLLRRASLIPLDGPLEGAVDAAIAREICEELGGLPLALDQAGAYIEETRCRPADFLNLYRTRGATMLNKRGSLVADYPRPVATTWSLSFEKVKYANPVAADLLQLCAFLQSDAIPEEIIMKRAAVHLGSSRANWLSKLLSFLLQRPSMKLIDLDSGVLDRAIADLSAYSLVRRNPNDRTISVHRLVQAVLRDAMDKRTQGRWARQAVLTVNAVFPVVEFTTWLQCERLLPQALMAAQVIERYRIVSEEAGRLLHEAASYLRDRARYGEAEPLFQRALQIRVQYLGSEHPLVAASLNNLAILYRNQGRYGEAEPLFQRALQIRERHLGPEHPEVAYSLHGLASLYRNQGKYGEAEPLFQRALQIRERHLGPEHHEVAYSLHGLADLYRNQGKYEEAEPLFQRALRIREKRLVPEHPDVAYSLHGLARLYSDQGKHAKAESHFQRALQIRVQHLGPVHPNVAYSLTGLADLYRNQGKYGEAEPLYQQALRIFEQQLGPEYLGMAYPLTGLANLYCEQGKYGEAELLFMRALQIREQKLGPEHLRVAYPLTGLADLYRNWGRYGEAEALFRQALRIREQHLRLEHPDVAYPLTGLANLYCEQGKYAEAEPLLLRVLRIREQAQGPQHPKTAETMHDLARLREKQDNNEEALIWYDRALVIRQRVLGLQHPKTMETCKHFITLLRVMGRHEQASQLEANQPES